MKRSPRFYLMEALKARGYSEITRDPAHEYWRIFRIYDNHPKQIGKNGDRIWVGTNTVRIGQSIGASKPMSLAQRRALTAEGKDKFNVELTEEAFRKLLGLPKEKPHAKR